MKNAQQYIEKNYPKFIQKNLKRLDISHLKLAGQLDLRNFPKLEELDCSNNQITELDLSGCINLIIMGFPFQYKQFPYQKKQNFLILKLRDNFPIKINIIPIKINII